MKKEVKIKLIKVSALVLTNILAIGAIKYGYLMSPEEKQVVDMTIVSILTGMF